MDYNDEWPPTMPQTITTRMDRHEQWFTAILGILFFLFVFYYFIINDLLIDHAYYGNTKTLPSTQQGMFLEFFFFLLNEYSQTDRLCVCHTTGAMSPPLPRQVRIGGAWNAYAFRVMGKFFLLSIFY